jgi:hypothetical protein
MRSRAACYDKSWEGDIEMARQQARGLGAAHRRVAPAFANCGPGSPCAKLGHRGSRAKKRKKLTQHHVGCGIWQEDGSCRAPVLHQCRQRCSRAMRTFYRDK